MSTDNGVTFSSYSNIFHFRPLARQSFIYTISRILSLEGMDWEIMGYGCMLTIFLMYIMTKNFPSIAFIPITGLGALWNPNVYISHFLAKCYRDNHSNCFRRRAALGCWPLEFDICWFIQSISPVFSI